jgi:DNA-binding CsgD family transcriptional regulator
MAGMEAAERLVQKYMVTEKEEEVLQLVSGEHNG